MIKISTDSSKKVIFVKVTGMVKKEEVVDYINELKNEISKINPREYTFIIDAKEQKALSQDAIPLMKDAFQIYVGTPFANRFSVVLDSAIASSQVNRVAKDDAEQFTMLSSVEEAYSKQ